MFDVDDTVWMLDVEDARVLRVADADKNYGDGNLNLVDKFWYGFHADVSPDGSRIVYSTCEYEVKGPVGPAYEIAVVNVDGSARKRLTTSKHFDNYPAWSPEGPRIAFITSPRDGRALYPEYYGKAKLAIMTVNDAGKRVNLRLLESTKDVALYPPVWSPDGQSLAYIAYEGEGPYSPYDHVVYTVRADSRMSEVNRVGKTISMEAILFPRGTGTVLGAALPTWSPDGEELAFAAMDGDEAGIYAAKPDGTDRRQVWSSGPDGASTPVFQVSWSPDGSKILLVSDKIHVVNSDGSGLSPLSDLEGGLARTAWSPDGSRIAVYYPGSKIIVTSCDGSDVQTLVTMSSTGLPVASGAGLEELPRVRDPAAWSPPARA